MDGHEYNPNNTEGSNNSSEVKKYLPSCNVDDSDHFGTFSWLRWLEGFNILIHVDIKYFNIYFIIFSYNLKKTI